MKPQYLKLLKGVIALTAFVILCYKAPLKINLGDSPSVQIGDVSKTETDTLIKTIETSQEKEREHVTETVESTKHKAIGLTYLRQAISKHHGCRLGAITAYGSGVVIFGDNGFAYISIPDGLRRILNNMREHNKRIKDIVLTNSGYYCVIYDKNGWWGNVPPQMKDKLNKFNSDHELIMSISISENGKCTIVTDKHWWASDHNDFDYIKARQQETNYGPKSICTSNDGLCVILDNDFVFSKGSAEIVRARLQELKDESWWPDRIVFTDYGTFLMTNEKETCTYHM